MLVVYVHGNFLNSYSSKKHIHSHTREKPFQCVRCSTLFSQNDSLQRHIISSHGTNRSFYCRLCEKRFSWQNKLDIHQHVHLSSSSNNCCICLKPLTTPSILRHHLNIHTGGHLDVKYVTRPLSTNSITNAIRIHKRK